MRRRKRSREDCTNRQRTTTCAGAAPDLVMVPGALIIPIQSHAQTDDGRESERENELLLREIAAAGYMHAGMPTHACAVTKTCPRLLLYTVSRSRVVPASCGRFSIYTIAIVTNDFNLHLEGPLTLDSLRFKERPKRSE